MKVRMLVSVAGLDLRGNGYSAIPGEVVEMNDKAAARYVESGQAEYVTGPEKARGGKSVEVRPATARREARG